MKKSYGGIALINSSRINSTAKKFVPYLFIALLINLILLSLYQVTGLFHEDVFLLLSINVWLFSLSTALYAQYYIRNFSDLPWSLTYALLFLAALVAISTFVVININQLILSDSTLVFINDPFWSVSTFVEFYFLQASLLMLFLLKDKWQKNYQRQLIGAGIDSELAQALFRVRAGYIGQNFIKKTLMKVAGLAESDNEQAQDMVEKLGSLMRYALETSQKSSITLTEEVEVLTEFCQLYRQVIFDQSSKNESSQLNLTISVNESDVVLPMALYGLLVYVLSKFSSKTEQSKNWQLNITLSNNKGLLTCQLTCKPLQTTLTPQVELHKLAQQLNDQVIDIMRNRIEQHYEYGGYIEFTCDTTINFTLCLPTIRKKS